MTNTLDTNWTTLIKIAQIESRSFYYYEYADYYELFLIVNPILFHAVMKRDGNKETASFDTTYKLTAIKLN